MLMLLLKLAGVPKGDFVSVSTAIDCRYLLNWIFYLILQIIQATYVTGYSFLIFFQPPLGIKIKYDPFLF